MNFDVMFGEYKVRKLYSYRFFFCIIIADRAVCESI